MKATILDLLWWCANKSVPPKGNKYPRRSGDKEHCNQRQRQADTALKMFLSVYCVQRTELQAGQGLGSVVGWWGIQRYALIPALCKYYRILKMGLHRCDENLKMDLPGFSGCVLNAIKSILVKERQRKIRHIKKGMRQCYKRGRDCSDVATSQRVLISPRSWKDQRTTSLLEPPVEMQPYWQIFLPFCLMKSISDFWPPKLWENKLLMP